MRLLLGGEPGGTPVRDLIDLPAQLATRHDHAALIGPTVIGPLVLWSRLPTGPRWGWATTPLRSNSAT
ncbi:hypothetical protein GCM10027615_30830 [Plantactinospora veratri]